MNIELTERLKTIGLLVCIAAGLASVSYTVPPAVAAFIAGMATGALLLTKTKEAKEQEIRKKSEEKRRRRF